VGEVLGAGRGLPRDHHRSRPASAPQAHAEGRAMTPLVAPQKLRPTARYRAPGRARVSAQMEPLNPRSEPLTTAQGRSRPRPRWRDPLNTGPPPPRTFCCARSRAAKANGAPRKGAASDASVVTVEATERERGDRYLIRGAVASLARVRDGGVRGGPGRGGAADSRAAHQRRGGTKAPAARAGAAVCKAEAEQVRLGDAIVGVAPGTPPARTARLHVEGAPKAASPSDRMRPAPGPSSVEPDRAVGRGDR